jgi:hypothetical protein|tara:strand:- start:5524 stop:6072 length:549 start_codon:yes stop_codon:yes gene_type:complete
MPAIVICLIYFSVYMLSAPNAASAEYTNKETSKIQYLFQLTKFIHWPDTLIRDTPIKLCLFPNTPQQDSWQKINLKRSQGREIRIHYLSEENDLQNCTILFAHKGMPNSFIQKNYYTLVSNRILSIGEREDFAKDGGVVELTMTNENTLDLKINLKTATEAGLSIDANLIEIASAVFEQGHP